MTNQASKFTSFLLNWYANPYHAPLFVAQKLKFYEDEGIHLAILQPTDPSDVTKIIGNNQIEIGLKAMIHTMAGRARGYPITSIGTLLDEPFTGLISLASAGIQQFSDIRGKTVGYIGEFGKKIIDNLAEHAGIAAGEYEAIRVGMYMVDAIKRGDIDAGIGFSNFHQVELEAHAPTTMLRIDQLAGLGCCCFCSIQFIAHEKMIQEHSELLSAFLRATERGMSYLIQYPDHGFELVCEIQPQFRAPLQRKIFTHTLPFFSRTLVNVERDWKKVYQYTQHLGLHQGELDLTACYTNDFIPAPHSEIEAVV